jgi:NADH/F420H2 dehydrogenase subunit C
MNKEELKARLEELLPTAVFEEGAEWMTMVIDPVGREGFARSWEAFAREIRSGEGLDFDYLFCVTAIDWKTHFTMVYHLTSTVYRHTVVVKVKLDHDHPVIRTVSDIWRTAEFHEREAYDLFGVVFTGHPDLRRLFMTDDWNGWPLRKDYEDPVNMIKL